VWGISWAPEAAAAAAAAAVQQVASKEGMLMELARQSIHLFSLRQRAPFMATVKLNMQCKCYFLANLK
jgi:ribosomal protein L5